MLRSKSVSNRYLFLCRHNFRQNARTILTCAGQVSALLSLVSRKAPLASPDPHTNVGAFFWFSTFLNPFPSRIPTVTEPTISPPTRIPTLGRFLSFSSCILVLWCRAQRRRPADRRCGACHSTVFLEFAYSCTPISRIWSSPHEITHFWVWGHDPSKTWEGGT